MDHCPSQSIDRFCFPFLQVKTSPGQVIKPDSWMVISSEGMPFHGRPFQKGNMYIHFSVTFPDTINDDQRSVLAAGKHQQLSSSAQCP